VSLDLNVELADLAAEPSRADWYRPGKKISEFHSSRARIRCLVGGRGTGKTTAIAVEATGHGFHNAGAKIYILRKTQDSNEDTTLETFEKLCFPQMGSAYADTGISLFKKIEGGKCFRLPSKKAVELFNKWKLANPNASKQQTLQWLDTVGERYCSKLYFAGVPEARYRGTRFRGYECSMLIFVEADQLSEEDLDLGVACLRWKGSDPTTCDEKGFIKDTCVILDTNPPGEAHWIAQMEARDKGRPDVRFWHIATEENRHNLPPNYIEDLERQYRRKPAMYKRMLLGEYADAFDGEPVLYAFEQGVHDSKSLPWPEGAYLIRSWDFGTINAVVFAAYWEEAGTEYWWDLHEYFARQSDVDRQCKAVLEITQMVFPFWNNRHICAGVKDYCDVAGNQKTDKGSSIAVLRTYDIFPGFQKMGLQESLAIYNRLLEKRDKFGNPVYRIDKATCPMLFNASIGGYRYPVQGEPGFGGDEPLKGPRGGDYDHIADASRYGKYNCLRLLRKEVEAMNKARGVFGHRPVQNRKKRYY
jgi:phage terminase large subunit